MFPVCQERTVNILTQLIFVAFREKIILNNLKKSVTFNQCPFCACWWMKLYNGILIMIQIFITKLWRKTSWQKNTELTLLNIQSLNNA